MGLMHYIRPLEEPKCRLRLIQKFPEELQSIMHSKRGTRCESTSLVCCLVGQIVWKLYQYLETLNPNRQRRFNYQWDFRGKYYHLRQSGAKKFWGDLPQTGITPSLRHNLSISEKWYFIMSLTPPPPTPPPSLPVLSVLGIFMAH